MNAAVQPVIDNDMKIVPSKINERGKVQQGDEKQRKIKTLKTKILQNVCHKNRALSSPSKPASINEMTDEQPNTNSNNNNNNNSSTVKTNYSETNKQIEGINNANANIVKSLETSEDIQSRQSNSCNNNNTKIDKNSNSELIIAEAAKIILKNGLNGTNAAAAAAVVLTAAANFQLPCNDGGSTDVPSTSNPKTAAAVAAQAQLVAIAAAAAAVNATNKKNCLNSSTLLIQNDQDTLTTATTTITAAASPTKIATTVATATKITTNNEFDTTSYIQSNNLTFTSKANITQYQFTKPSHVYANNNNNNNNSAPAMDMGVIDYTINNDAASKSKTKSTLSPISAPTTPSPPSLKGSLCGSGSGLKNNSHNRSDRAGRDGSPLTQYANHNNGGFHSWNKFDLTGSGSSSSNSNHTNGGRLQFFKDGKFILELARAKDGEKGRWVYVPRKHFRTPSAATSSTITPCASILTAAAASVPSALPASSATVAAVVVASTSSGFPKNECSNSLSFSDDNSSIQSSPWQRDHCFKQTAPQKNISTEMAYYYQRPHFQKLSPQALIKARKKFRKPYNEMTISHDFLYINNKEIEENAEACQDKDDEISGNEIHNNEIKNVTVPSRENNQSDVEVNELTVADGDTTIVKSSDDLDGAKANGSGRVDKENGDRVDDGADSVNQDKEKSQNLKCEAKINEIKLVENGIQSKSLNTTQLQRNNTPRRLMASCKTKGQLLLIVQKLTDVCKQRLSNANVIAAKTFTKAAAQSSCSSETLVVASTAIGPVQNIPLTTVSHISKVSPTLSLSSTSSSNSTASRLIDYHQQHVSPRKRILREMEKVSLEDTGAVGTAKRSRPKRYNNASTTTNVAPTINNPSQTTQLMPCDYMYQSKVPLSVSNCNNVSGSGNIEKLSTNLQNNPPTTKVYSSYSIHSLLSSHSSSNGSNSGGGAVAAADSGSTKRRDFSPNNHSMQDNSYHNYNVVQTPNVLDVTSKSPESQSTDGKSSVNYAFNRGAVPSPYASPSPGREKRSQSPVTASTNNMVGDYVNYGRTSDAAHSSLHKLRYMSNSSEHISPNYNHHHHQHQQQQHYLHHAPLVAHQQTYYSPYMTSPQYVPTPNKISPRNNTSSPTSPMSSSSSSVASNNSSTHTPSSAIVTAAATSSSKSSSSTMIYMGGRSHSPQRHPSAFRSTTSNMANAGNTTAHIPTQKDYSPTRSISTLSGSSTRDNIPRTVPKKTASIRRQFASPTINCGSGDGSATNTATVVPTNNSNNHNNKRNSSSPLLHENRSSNENIITSGGSHRGNNNENGCSNDRQQLPLSLMHQQQHQQQQQAHMLPRSSPGLNLPCSSLYSYPYQMYISPASTNNVSGAGDALSPRNTSTAHNETVQPSQSQSQPVPPPPPPLPLPLSSSYIPTVVGSSYYHPYISTLAAMRHPQIWMQHYQNAAPALLQARHSSLTNSRLITSPYHGFHYNGTMTNALAAAVAAAAAAGFGNATLGTTASTSASISANQHQTTGLLPLVALPQDAATLFNHTNGSSFVDNMSNTLMGTAGSPSSSSSISNTCIKPNTLTTDHATTTTIKTASIGNSSSLSLSSSSIGNHDMPSLYAYNHSSKDEQSSDVPLNLSKH